VEAASAYHGFIYRDGVLHDIGSLPGSRHTLPAAINDRGVVVGSASSATGQPHAFLYDDGAFKDLGTLGGSTPYSYATDINSRGTVVGYSSSPAGESAFVYEGGVMRAIVSDPAISRAKAINDRGDVVGQIGFQGGAFLYSDGVVVRLDQLQAVKDAGWTLYSIEGINDRGWITGHGFKMGTLAAQSFVLKPR
jgi:probable HAF family extracellular repeat protein